jgi:hypothetical protein
MRFALILFVVVLLYVGEHGKKRFDGGVHGQQVSSVDAASRSQRLLRALHYKVTRQVAPLESEAFIYQLGGLSLDGTYFDDLSWRKLRNFTGDSPQYALHTLVDEMPALSTWMQSMGSMAELWQSLFTRYQWQDAIWEHARCTLLETTVPSVDELHSAEFDVLAYAEQLLERNHTLFARCLKRFGASICAEQAALRTETVDEAFSDFLALNDSSAPLDEQFRVLHACNGDVIMMDAHERFNEMRRAELGKFAELAPFMRAAMSPQRWWMWFVDLSNSTAANSTGAATTTTNYAQFYEDEKLLGLVPAVDDYFAPLNASDSGSQPLEHWTWASLGGNTGYDDDVLSLELLAERCEDLRIDADVARVDIERPWFDPLLLRQVKPLSMRGVNVSQWSNGELHTSNADGDFPLHSVAMIVARNVCFSSPSWDQYFVEDLLAESNRSSVPGQERFASDDDGGQEQALVVGPFTLIGDAYHFGLRGASRNASLLALPDGAGFCIAQAQVLGWVVRATPLAPTDVFHDNFELGRCDPAVLEPWNNSYPPDHCLVTLNQFADNDTLGEFDDDGADDDDGDDDGAEDDDGLRYLDSRGMRAWIPWSAASSRRIHCITFAAVFAIVLFM